MMADAEAVLDATEQEMIKQEEQEVIMFVVIILNFFSNPACR